MKLKDALGKYQDYYYKMAVWEEVLQHLRTFLDEGGVSSDKNIATSFGTQGQVPEAVIKGLMIEIGEGPLAAIETELSQLEEMEIGTATKRKAKKAPARSRTKKAGSGAGGAGSRKPLRAVPK